MQEKLQLLKPKIDVVFHALLKKGNEGIAKSIIKATTKEKIETVEIDNDRHLVGKYAEEKLGIVDLKAKLDNGTICDIEIQLADNKDTAERFLFYWSRIYSSQLAKGDNYGQLNKVIGIIIIDYELQKTKEVKRLSTKWKIKEVSTGKEIELTDVLELHIIEIPKAKKILQEEPDNELAQWVMFINNPNESEVSRIMEENKEIEEAMSELEKLSKDRELRRVAELREKAIRDEKNGLRHAREEGIEETSIKIAQKLKKENMPIEKIAEITGLTEEKIKSI